MKWVNAINKKTTWHNRTEKVVNRVNTAFPNPEFENWNLCEELILSATATHSKIIEFDIETDNAVSLLNY